MADSEENRKLKSGLKTAWLSCPFNPLLVSERRPARLQIRHSKSAFRNRLVLLRRGGRGRAAEGAADAAAGAGDLFDGVVGGDLEERGRGLGARDVRQA